MDDTQEIARVSGRSSGAGSSAAPARQRSAASPERRLARLVLYLGIVLVIAGAVALYAGYNGAATNHLFAAQVPYMISGGFAGLGILLLGGIALGLHAILNAQMELRREIASMRAAMRDVADALTFARPGGPGAPSANGHVVVARGGGTYHRADCRIVSRAEGTRSFTEEQAAEAGLTACRVCNP